MYMRKRREKENIDLTFHATLHSNGHAKIQAPDMIRSMLKHAQEESLRFTCLMYQTLPMVPHLLNWQRFCEVVIELYYQEVCVGIT